MTAMPLLLTAYVLLAVLGAAPGLNAQTVGQTTSLSDMEILPPWGSSWNPLRRLADIPRTLPRATEYPDLLRFSGPRLGVFWTAGNPAGLVDDVRDDLAEFQLSVTDAGGEYARPLDPGGESSVRLSTLAWRRLTDRVAVVGQASFGRTALRDSVLSDVLLPYASNPFIVADTLGAPLRRNAANLSGAIGWRFGPLQAGISAGWFGQSTRTDESGVPRLNRSAGPGLSAGAMFDAGRRVALAGHARWRQQADLTQLLAVSQQTRVFEIEGYGEPVPFDIANETYRRRFERREWAVGGAVSAEIARTSLVLNLERTRAIEDQFSRTNENSPPKDVWEARGWDIGVAAQRLLGAGMLTAGARYRNLNGEAARSDLEAVVFLVDEGRGRGWFDFRTPSGRAWQLGLRASLARDVHDRHDLLDEVGSEIRAWQTGLSIELARRLGERLSVAVGTSGALRRASGEIPEESDLGPRYQRLLGRGLELEQDDSSILAARVTLKWQSAGSAGFWLRSEYGRLAPSASDGTRGDAHRRGLAVSLGATLTGRSTH